MPTVDPAHHKNPTRLRIRVIVALILAMVICVVVFIALRLTQPTGPTAAQVQQQAQALDNDHNYVTEQKVLEDYVTSHKPSKDQYWLLIQLGNLAIDKRDYKNTLKWYKQAESVTGKTGQTDAVGIAMADASLGNKAEAISYYKKAIALTDSGSPDNNIGTYKAAITALGGTP